jgi:hypothetical protein
MSSPGGPLDSTSFIVGRAASGCLINVNLLARLVQPLRDVRFTNNPRCASIEQLNLSREG